MDFTHFLEHWDDGVAYIAILWSCQAIIGTMPAPLSDERWYGWLYNFLQILAANLKSIKSKEVRKDPPEEK